MTVHSPFFFQSRWFMLLPMRDHGWRFLKDLLVGLLQVTGYPHIVKLVTSNNLKLICACWSSPFLFSWLQIVGQSRMNVLVARTFLPACSTASIHCANAISLIVQKHIVEVLQYIRLKLKLYFVWIFQF